LTSRMQPGGTFFGIMHVAPRNSVDGTCYSLKRLLVFSMQHAVIAHLDVVVVAQLEELAPPAEVPD
jgi:hypothetical protein